MNPSNVETILLQGELALADEDFPAARRAVRELAEEEPTVRALTIMAAIEKGEGADDKTVRAWLNKALDAPRGNQWICDNCSNIHSHWQARCSNCEAFDSLSWKAAPVQNSDDTPTLGFMAGILTDETQNDAETDVEEVTSPSDLEIVSESDAQPSDPDAPHHHS